MIHLVFIGKHCICSLARLVYNSLLLWFFWPHDLVDIRPLFFLYPQVYWSIPLLRRGVRWLVNLALYYLDPGEDDSAVSESSGTGGAVVKTCFQVVLVAYKCYALGRFVWKCKVVLFD